jgi:TonB family protein
LRGLASLLLTIGMAIGMAAGAGAAERALEPVQSGEALLEHAKAVKVERRAWAEHDRGKIASVSCELGSDWIRRLGRLALRDAQRLPDTECHVACGRCPDQLLVDVRFRADGEEHFLSLRPREGLAMLLGMRTGAWSFADTIPAVMALIREALPKDAAVRDWAGSGTAQPQPPPDSAASRFDDFQVTTLPEPVERVRPRYPPVAQTMGTSGEVRVKALVTPDGAVADVAIARSIRGLDNAALDAVRAWRFKPARCGDQPVAVWVTIPVRFTLHNF